MYVKRLFLTLSILLLPLAFFCLVALEAVLAIVFKTFRTVGTGTAQYDRRQFP